MSTWKAKNIVKKSFLGVFDYMIFCFNAFVALQLDAFFILLLF